jgi:hypothetical protein
MRVLFLGGPWHNERHDVTPIRSHRMTTLPAEYTVPVAGAVLGSADTDGTSGRPSGPRELVTYTRRYARGRGERIPVYVSPDYQGPARA